MNTTRGTMVIAHNRPPEIDIGFTYGTDLATHRPIGDVKYTTVQAIA